MFLPLAFYAFSGLANCITSLFLGILIFVKTPQLKTNRLFAYFCFSVAFWSWFFYVWASTPNKIYAEYYLRTCMVGVFFMPSLFIHFICLLGKIKKHPAFFVVNYFLSTIFMLFVYTPLYAYNPGRFLVFPYWLHAGLFCHLAIIHFCAIVIYSFYLLWRCFKATTGIAHTQILYVFVGTAVGYFCGALDYFAWYQIPIPPFLNIFISFYVITVTYAIVKYRLMDIRLATTLAGIFAAVYIVVLGFPFWLGIHFGNWFYATIAMLILATLGPIIYSVLRRKAEAVLLRKQKERAAFLTEASQKLYKQRSDKVSILKSTLELLRKMNPSYIALYVRSPKSLSYYEHQLSDKGNHGFETEILETASLVKAISSNRKSGVVFPELIESYGEVVLHDTIVIPFYSKDSLYAFCICGSKKDNSAYSQLDVDAFGTLAINVSLALENSIYSEQSALEDLTRRRESMSNFSLSLAHEINNPISAVVFDLYTLMEQIETKWQGHISAEKLPILKGRLQRCHDSSERIMNMVKTIKDFSTQPTCEKELMKLSDLLEYFNTMFDIELKAFSVKNPDKLVSFKQEIEPGLEFMANRILFAQVLIFPQESGHLEGLVVA